MKITLLSLIIGIFALTNLNAQHVLETTSGKKINGKLVSSTSNEIIFKSSAKEEVFTIQEVQSITFVLDDNSTMNSGTKGVYYKMPGRELTKQPTVNNLTEKKGVVVVEIIIDKYGTVREATPGAEGTTTSDKYLLTMAKKAAESARFNDKPSAPLQQTGVITITF